jgi:hypothetical protein
MSTALSITSAAAPIATVVTLAVGSVVGFAVYTFLPPQDPGQIPWKDLAGGGSAVLMFAAVLVFLRFLREERLARDQERAREREADREMHERLANAHASTIEKMGETQMTLMRQILEDKNK